MKDNTGPLVVAGLVLLSFVFMWVIKPRALKTSPAAQPVATVQKPRAPSIAVLTPAQTQRAAAHVATWSPAPSYEADFNALDPSYKIASRTDSLFDPLDDYWGLPRDKAGDFELVDAYCTACHSLSIVMQQRATPDRWQELLVWMEKKQGMSPLPKEDEEKVLKYVGTYFSTK